MPKKETMENAFRETGVKPVGRRTIAGNDVLLADGFCKRPELAFAKFGVEPGDFPDGCYVSAWLCAQDEKIQIGRPLFFETTHDVESLPLSGRQAARLNAAAEDAEKTLLRLKKVEGHGFAV